MKEGKIDLILVTKLDRLYRNIRHYLNLQDTLDKHGVNWIAIWETIYDTTTPQGRLIINQMMSIAQFEAEHTAQRIRQVFEYKTSIGEVSSGITPLGYKIVNKRLVPDEYADAVRMVFEHYDKTGTLWETQRYAKTIGIDYTAQGIRRLLRNVKYAGEHNGNPDFCPAIVPRPLFDSVQRKLDMNVRYSTRRDYIFTGLIICPGCGRRMSGLMNWTYKKDGEIVKEQAYTCESYRIGRCSNNAKFKECSIEAYLLTNLEDIVLEYEVRQKPQLDNSRQIAALRAKVSRLKTLYLNGLMQLDEYKTDKAQYEAQITALQEEHGDVKDLSNVKGLLSGRFVDVYATLTNVEKRYIWRSVIKTIKPHRTKPRSQRLYLEVDFL